MSDFFGFLFFINIILLIIGLSRPSIFQKLFKGRTLDRKFILKIFGISAIILFILIGLTAEPTTQEELNPSDNQQQFEENRFQENIAAEDEVAPAVALTQTPNATLYSVTQVVDGDTIKVLMDNQTETIRLIGLDTPETVDPRKTVQCFGQEASAKAKELLTGKNVVLEADSTQGERDKYGRLLRYAFLEDGTLFNKLMISEGYAHEYTYNSNPYKYQADFQAAEKEARENGRGLWNANTCAGNTTQAATVVNNSSEPAPDNTAIAALAASDNQPAATSVDISGPQVKKSTSDICHEKGTTYYERTSNYEAFDSIEDCLASGGRLPKR